MQASPGQRINLPLLPVLPFTIFYADISYNASLWGNVAYARFYGMRGVAVKPPAKSLR